MLGNGRLEAMCFDGEKRLAHIRGKMRKKVWINQGDIILLSLRDFQDDKADVIVKYTADEARNRACHMFLLYRLSLTSDCTCPACSESLRRTARKRQNQRDRDIRRRGWRVHIRVWRRGRGRHRRYLRSYRWSLLLSVAAISSLSSLLSIICIIPFCDIFIGVRWRHDVLEYHELMIDLFTMFEQYFLLFYQIFVTHNVTY